MFNQLGYDFSCSVQMCLFFCDGKFQASRDAVRVQILQTYRQTAKKDHMQMLRRRQMIEDRKEELENLTFQRVYYPVIHFYSHNHVILTH